MFTQDSDATTIWANGVPELTKSGVWRRVFTVRQVPANVIIAPNHSSGTRLARSAFKPLESEAVPNADETRWESETACLRWHFAVARIPASEAICEAGGGFAAAHSVESVSRHGRRNFSVRRFLCATISVAFATRFFGGASEEACLLLAAGRRPIRMFPGNGGCWPTGFPRCGLIASKEPVG